MWWHYGTVWGFTAALGRQAEGGFIGRLGGCSLCPPDGLAGGWCCANLIVRNQRTLNRTRNGGRLPPAWPESQSREDQFPLWECTPPLPFAFCWKRFCLRLCLCPDGQQTCSDLTANVAVHCAELALLLYLNCIETTGEH